MSKKSCPFLHSESLYKNGQGLLNIQYIVNILILLCIKILIFLSHLQYYYFWSGYLGCYGSGFVSRELPNPKFDLETHQKQFWRQIIYITRGVQRKPSSHICFPFAIIVRACFYWLAFVNFVVSLKCSEILTDAFQGGALSCTVTQSNLKEKEILVKH